jgi:hypothetical protein
LKKKVINLGLSLKVEDFLTARRTVIFSRTLRHVFYLVSSRGIGKNCILKYGKVILYTLLRRIFGPTKERDGTWRVKTNDELDELIRHKSIINHIPAQRLSWFGHLHRMPEERMVKRVYKWKPMLTRRLGRPKNRWEDDIINYMKKLKIKNWTSCIHDRNKWKLYVEKAKTFKE